MNNTAQAQHPAVVLRSSYLRLRAFLAIAASAVAGLTAAVVVLALDSATTTARPPGHANPPAITNHPAAPAVPRVVKGDRSLTGPAYQPDWAAQRAGERATSQLPSRSLTGPAYQPDWAAQRAGERHASQLPSESPAGLSYQPDWAAQRAGERTTGTP
jgi:hypothetical protein